MKEKIEGELVALRNLREVQVECVDETIYLTGRCSSYFSKQVAQEIAMKFGKVVNSIVVESSQQTESAV